MANATGRLFVRAIKGTVGVRTAAAEAMAAPAATVSRASSRASAARQAQPASTAASAAASTWSAEGLSQMELMHKDECVLLDEGDNVVGHDNKYNTHTLTHPSFADQPHRAFSVFLLSEDGRLLLQQRASSKVTFPLAWTNTCCSHPLHGQSHDEVVGANPASDDEVAAARHWHLPHEAEGESAVLGVIRAARRKLQHELGVDPADVPVSSFAFLGRIHYRAPSDDTWGEHEIDYLLLCRPRGAAMGPGGLGGGGGGGGDVSLRPNPEEVEAVRYVTPDELKALLAEADAAGDSSADGLKISPWFRLIADRLLGPWWDHATAGDLDPATHGLPVGEVRRMELGDIDGATGRRRS